MALTFEPEVETGVPDRLMRLLKLSLAGAWADATSARKNKTEMHHTRFTIEFKKLWARQAIEG